MIDFRHQTFLTLCEIKNYTKTAEQLYITQPAVTQHIKYLEEAYNCKLFIYKNKKLNLTPEGKQLYDLLNHVLVDTTHFKRNILNKDTSKDTITFGATLSIGEYIMPKVIIELSKDNPDLNIHMEVSNTKVLLEQLRIGEIDFAIVEGEFDKSNYHSLTFSLERFIPICSPKSNLAKNTINFSEIFKYPLIVREIGSGTRTILESIVKQHNYSFDSFNKIIEIGNMNAIKELVSSNIGISFLYEPVAHKELKEGSITEIEILDLEIIKEFNFVFLKNSFFENKYTKYFNKMKEAYLQSK